MCRLLVQSRSDISKQACSGMPKDTSCSPKCKHECMSDKPISLHVKHLCVHTLFDSILCSNCSSSSAFSAPASSLKSDITAGMLLASSCCSTVAGGAACEEGQGQNGTVSWPLRRQFAHEQHQGLATAPAPALLAGSGRSGAPCCRPHQSQTLGSRGTWRICSRHGKL